jgi:hypothetical protein
MAATAATIFSTGRLTAIDHPGGAGHEGCCIAGEKRHDSRNIKGCPEPTEGNSGNLSSAGCRPIAGSGKISLEKGRADRPGANHIDANTGRREFHGKRSAPSEYGPLARTVRRVAGLADESQF